MRAISSLSPLYLSFAVLLGVVSPAFAQGTSISLIDLVKRERRATFPACNEPAAIVWAPAPAAAACDCDEHRDDDRDQRRDHDRKNGDDDHCKCEHHDRDGLEHRSSSVRHSERRHGDKRRHGDEDDDDDDCAAVSNTAYAVCDGDSQLLRIDLTPPIPVATSLGVVTYDVTVGGVTTHLPIGSDSLAIDPTATRALVAGDPADTVSYLDITKTPAVQLGLIKVPLPPLGDRDISSVAFFGTTRALILQQQNLYIADLTKPLGDPSNKVVVRLSSPGITVAVDTARKRAAVGLDLGGVQLVDLATNTLVGPELGESGDTLGIAIAPAGTPAIAIYESHSSTKTFPSALVVNVGAAPSIAGTIDLSSMDELGRRGEPSAVVFNPVTADALIAGDFGVAIIPPPYTAISLPIIRYTGFSGATKYGIAADATRALVVNEDSPTGVVPPVLIPPAATGGDDHGSGCARRRHEHLRDRDDDRRGRGDR
jgi:hypothetical protein